MPVTLIVTSNEITIGAIVADQYREDLKEAGIGEGYHSFNFEFPKGVIHSARHVIRIFRKDDRAELPGSPITLNASQSFESVSSALTGSIDFLNLERVEGWARDELRPDTSLSLIITNNGEFLGRVLANKYRQDLKEAGFGSGRLAFNFDFPVPLGTSEDNVITITRETDGIEIPGSPVVLKASQSFDTALAQSLANVLDRCRAPEDIPRKIDFLVGQIDKLLQQKSDKESLRADRDRHRRLIQRWKTQSASDGIEVLPRYATFKSLLRALVIDDRLPKLDRDAGSNAIWSHILSLQRLGYQVTIVPAEDLNPRASERVAIEATGVVCCCLPYYASVEEVMRRQAGEFDVIYLHRVSSASKYGELAACYFPKARRIFSVADLHHVRVLRQAASEDRPELIARGKRLRLAEFAAAAFSSAVITHSNSETELLKSQVPGATVFTIPWAVRAKPTNVPYSKRNGFAFIGGFGHAPNFDAARWLIHEIVPLVLSRDPSIECLLVGSDFPDSLRKIATNGVVPVGHVENLTEIFDRVRVTVAPLTFGAGIKGKVLESLAAGIPCVCTAVAAEGLDLPTQLRALVADTPDAIADMIVRVHNDQIENEDCRRAGLEYITGDFSEDRLDLLMAEVVEPSRVQFDVSRRIASNGGKGLGVSKSTSAT